MRTNAMKTRAIAGSNRNERSEQVLTFKFRLLPSRKQHQSLSKILENERQLYNGALESKIDCYRKTGRTLSYYEQQRELTELRQDADFSTIPLNLQRATLI